MEYHKDSFNILTVGRSKLRRKRPSTKLSTHPYSSKQCLSLIMAGWTARSVRMMRFCRCTKFRGNMKDLSLKEIEKGSDALRRHEDAHFFRNQNAPVHMQAQGCLLWSPFTAQAIHVALQQCCSCESPSIFLLSFTALDTTFSLPVCCGTARWHHRRCDASLGTGVSCGWTTSCPAVVWHAFTSC